VLATTGTRPFAEVFVEHALVGEPIVADLFPEPPDLVVAGSDRGVAADYSR
jgi:hypothetical protein